MNRVLHLRSSCGLYGADRALLDLAAETPAPFEAAVGSIVRPSRDDALFEEARRRGLPAWRIESAGKVDLRSARALVDRIRAERIALLHAHDYKGLTLAALASVRARVPVVATFHGDTAASAALRAYEALARLLGNVTRAVAAVSVPLAKKLRWWAPLTRVHYIPNGIRPGPICGAAEKERARAELGIDNAQTVIAVIGRLSKEKGHAVLFEALWRLPDALRPLTLVAGDGALRRDLEARARGLNVRWLGFLERPRAVYAAADLIVMPSLTEGLPLVGLEAMCAGRPLVASAVGELPAMLEGGAGFLVKPGDPGSLATALEQALRDERARAAASERAAARVRHGYGLEQMAERYARLIYVPALSKRGSTARSAPGR
ncbi:MAG: glycosyltransferase family 4 protein [Myxococcaceae bacterium]|nr:glycosyltransferase family 4 protein [Myxococcaceae bacterium]